MGRRAGRPTGPNPPGEPDADPANVLSPGEPLTALIEQALLALGSEPAGTRFLAAVDALVDLDGREEPGAHRPEAAVAGDLLRLVGRQWEQGWQPLDVVHVVRREANARSTRLVVATIRAWVADRGKQTSAESPAHPPEPTAPDVDLGQMPQRWLAQLNALAIPVAPGNQTGVTFLSRWRQSEAIGVTETLEWALKLVNLLGGLTPLSALDDPPSIWGRSPHAPRPLAAEPGRLDNIRTSMAEAGTDTDAASAVSTAKLLGTIRALLAKAESTSFTAEAEAFTAKAQDLMSRHAIDAAVLAAQRPPDLGLGVLPRRVHIDNPYANEKCMLLGQLAELNNSQVVWSEEHSMATVVGFPLDGDLIELLFTSLLIQANRAATSVSRLAADNRSPSFRRAFYIAYAQRIGERLGQVHRRARDAGQARYGADLVPILTTRREAVTRATKRLFPATVAMGPRQVHAGGWAAGRRAADLADLHTTQ